MRTHANLYDEFGSRARWFRDDDGNVYEGEMEGEDEGEGAKSDDEAPASPIAAVVVLSAAVGLLVICAGNLIRTTEDIMEKTGVNREFISFILLPSTFSTARNIAAVNMATGLYNGSRAEHPGWDAHFALPGLDEAGGARGRERHVGRSRAALVANLQWRT
ncbi:hypothetical protein PG999_003866 [Apiospora kogelbergensis]|uniref:Uncharacterized protein n=1 Tax=Apiospora kogelbergensis TaxID=1337665 RepID=A0AAW0R4N3_9PEZI